MKNAEPVGSFQTVKLVATLGKDANVTPAEILILKRSMHLSMKP